MTEVISNMFDIIVKKFDYYVDPRSKDKFFISTPGPTLAVVCVYLIVIKIILPNFMKNRKPFDLKKALFYYNLFQVFLSAYIMYLSWGSGYIRRFSIFKCRDLDLNESDPDAQMAYKAVYIYYFSKFTEFLDTVFFVLRKKYNQVSFLHIYHHATMPINAFIACKISPGGSTAMATGTNSFIHVIMYTYYLLSGLGPRWQKYLWWKKYLTTFQLIQFVFGVWQVYLVLSGDCPNMQKINPFLVYGMLYIISLIFLFQNFYNKSYKTGQNNNNNVQIKMKGNTEDKQK